MIFDHPNPTIKPLCALMILTNKHLKSRGVNPGNFSASSSRTLYIYTYQIPGKWQMVTSFRLSPNPQESVRIVVNSARAVSCCSPFGFGLSTSLQTAQTRWELKPMSRRIFQHSPGIMMFAFLVQVIVVA